MRFWSLEFVALGRGYEMILLPAESVGEQPLSPERRSDQHGRRPRRTRRPRRRQRRNPALAPDLTTVVPASDGESSQTSPDNGRDGQSAPVIVTTPILVPVIERFMEAREYYPTETSTNDPHEIRFVYREPVSPPEEGTIGAAHRQLREEQHRLGLRSHANYVFGMPDSSDNDDDDFYDPTRECFNVEMVDGHVSDAADSSDQDHEAEEDDQNPRRRPRAAPAASAPVQPVAAAPAED